MEVLNYGGYPTEMDHLRSAVLSFCHSRQRCYGCPLRHPICAKGKPYRLISEWTDGEIREAIAIMGEER